MTVKAITRIEHGEDNGSTTVYEIGDTLDGKFDDDALRAFVVGGSAVEVGSKRKFTEAPTAATPADEATAKRDALIAESLRGDSGSPAAEAAAGSPSAETGGETTIAEASSDKKNK